jgi:hypothetical protein
MIFPPVSGLVNQSRKMLNLTPRSSLFWIGGDLGYTNDLTEIVVFQEMEIGERSLLKMILHLHLEHVA